MANLPVRQLLESASPLPKPSAGGEPPGATAAALAVRARCQRLATLLEVDAAWSTSSLSEGQRRRVQLACGLAAPKELLLLDEVWGLAFLFI